MVRIDVQACGEQNVIDLSTEAAQHRFFNQGAEGYGEWAMDNWHYLNLSLKWKEELFMWRGAIPMDVFDVVDPYTGKVPGKLQNFLPSGSQPSAPTVTLPRVPALCQPEPRATSVQPQPAGTPAATTKAPC